MRGLMVVAGVFGLLYVAGPARGQELPSSPFRYAVFATGDVTLRDGARAVEGDVGSNDGTVIVGKRVLVVGSVAGRTIRVRQQARTGSLFCLLLDAPAGLACDAVTLPLVNPALLPPVQVTPGTTVLRVPPRGSTSPIPAGAYGNVRIGPRGQLVLAGGTYAVRSIRIQPRGELLCAAPCRIGVAETVRLQPDALLGGTDGTRADQVRVEVARRAQSPVFAASPRSNVAAVVYAPGGRIDLRNRGNFAGAFVGSRVVVGNGAIVQASDS